MTSTPATDYVVDASVVIARFVEPDSHHNNVLPFWDELERGQVRFHLPTLAVVETAGIIHKRVSLSDMAAAVYWLEQLTETGRIIQYTLDAQ